MNAERRSMTMVTQKSKGMSGTSSKQRRTLKSGSTHVTEARALAQRAKLDTQKQEHTPRTVESNTHRKAKGISFQQDLQAKCQAATTIASAIEDYLQDHEGGNHSDKTLEWHQTALGLLRTYLEQVHGITAVDEVEASDISSWFAYMRKMPGRHGKPRSERTIQTYARSARAFFYWLVRRGTIESSPFSQVAFPKVGRPLIETITAEEFEWLLQACSAPGESGIAAERAAVRNRAIFWLLYDTGIRVSELCGLRKDNLDRKHGVITVMGKGKKQRRIALGNNCLRHVLYYLDRHRPDEEELREWGSAEEDHLFLAETRTPLTKNGVEMLFKRVRERAGITDRRLSPHILRHTFAINYLISGGDPFSLQELLGHESMETVKIYMRMNDEMIQGQKRKFSPGDHLSTRMPGLKEGRRRSFNVGKDEKRRKK
jgi:integrase/recombinase XerD